MHHQSTLFPSTIEEVRTCAICGGPLARRSNEVASKFALRQTCSRECRFRLSTRRSAEARQPAELPPKTCLVCGKPYHKARLESYLTWEKRKSCSVECRAALISKANSNVWHPRACEWCGTAFEKRAEEPGKQFRKRRCCSPTCQYQMMISTRLQGEPSKSPYPKAWTRQLKEQVRDRDGHRCQECGKGESKRAHHVHHIDYRKDNLDPSNLITLCHSCHGRTCNYTNRGHFIDRYRTMMAARGDIAA